MSYTITLGWWLLPAVLTIVLLLWAIWPREDEQPSGGYFDFFFLPAMFRSALALIVSLIAWLIWALVR